MLNFFHIFPTLLFGVIFALISFLNVNTVCAQKTDFEPVTIELTSEERAWLKAHPDIRLGYTDTLEPEVIVDPDGTYSGMLVDFLDALNERLGTRIGLRVYSIPELLDKAKTKSIDGIPNLHPEYADSLGLLKTQTYWPAYLTVFARKGASFVSPDDFADKRVAIIDKVHITQKFMDQHGKQAVILKVDNALEGLRSVENGTADLFLGLSYNSFFIPKYQLLDVVPANVFMDSPEWFGIGIRTDWPVLVSILNKGIASFSKQEIHAIISKWSYLPEKKDTIELTYEERDWLKAHPDIELGYTDAFEPEVITNPDGSHRGILVDFLDELNRRLGTRIRLRIDPIPELLGKAQKRETDGILNVLPEYADKLGLLKTEGYLTGYGAVFTRKNIVFGHPSDLAGKKVAIIDGVMFTELIVERYGAGATILKVNDALEGLQRVDRGEVDVFLGASINAYFLSKYQLFGLALQYVYYSHPYKGGMAIRPDWPELVSILNKGISSFSKEEIEAIVSRWIQLPQRKEVIALTPKEKAWLAKNHTVRVFSTEHAPLMSYKGVKPSGITADFLNEVSKRTGIKFDITKPLGDFPSALKGLIESEGPDVMAALNPTPEREKVILFTKPYVSSPKFIFIRNDAGFVSSMANLSGKTVAVIGGYVTHKLLAKNYPDINLLTYKKNEAALRAVSSGEAFAFIGSMLATSSMINEYGLTNLKASAPSALPDATVAMGIRKDWPELRDIINKVFDALPEREKTEIINKWSSVKIEYGIKPARVIKWILVVAGSASGIVFLLVFWNRSLAKQVRKRTVELERINESLETEIDERKHTEERLQEHQQRLKALASQLTITEEKERRRIAAELHDQIGQTLALTRLQIAAAQKSAPDAGLKTQLDDISRSLLQTVQDTRNIIYDLSPPQMNEVGLAAAISDWVDEQIEKRHGLETEVIVVGQKKTLDNDVRAILFRNTRELLTNTIKHARGSKVTVRLEFGEIDLKVVVWDNGVGFDPGALSDSSQSPGGFGLFSIQERMADLGGALEIESAPGKGCTAILTMPVDD